MACQGRRFEIEPKRSQVPGVPGFLARARIHVRAYICAYPCVRVHTRALRDPGTSGSVGVWTLVRGPAPSGTGYTGGSVGMVKKVRGYPTPTPIAPYDFDPGAVGAESSCSFIALHARSSTIVCVCGQLGENVEMYVVHYTTLVIAHGTRT